MSRLKIWTTLAKPTDANESEQSRVSTQTKRDIRRAVYDAIVELNAELDRTPMRKEVIHVAHISPCSADRYWDELCEDGIIEANSLAIHNRYRNIIKINPYVSRRKIGSAYGISDERSLYDRGVIELCLNCPHDKCISVGYGCKAYKAKVREAKERIRGKMKRFKED